LPPAERPAARQRAEAILASNVLRPVAATGGPAWADLLWTATLLAQEETGGLFYTPGGAELLHGSLVRPADKSGFTSEALPKDLLQNFKTAFGPSLGPMLRQTLSIDQQKPPLRRFTDKQVELRFDIGMRIPGKFGAEGFLVIAGDRDQFERDEGMDWQIAALELIRARVITGALPGPPPAPR
jgi:hypothetical protein